MKKCPECGKIYDNSWGVCLNCSGSPKLEQYSTEEEKVDSEEARQRTLKKNKEESMIVTTTDTIEGETIKHYLGIVNGISITGFGALREFFSGFTDALGGSSGSYQKEYSSAKDLAIQQVKHQACKILSLIHI